MKSLCTALAVLILLGGLIQAIAQTAGSGSWMTLAPVPLARQEISAAALNGKIYVIAGFTGSGTSTNDVQVYNPATNSWSSAGPLPIMTNHNAAAVTAGRLYAFGGTSNRTFVYNPEQNVWSDLAAMRFMHGNTPAVAVINNRIYVAGGTGPGMIGNEAEVYDPFTNSWTSLPAMTVPRNHSAGGNINGKFYVAGGRGSATADTALEVYDPQTNAWTSLAPMPTGRSGIAAGVVNGELYVFGGEIPRLFGEVEVYSPLLNSWRSLPLMPNPRHGIFAAAIDNAIHLPGGATQQGLGPTTINDVFVVPPRISRIVPIVLDVDTGSAHFTTELTLTNRMPGSIRLNLRYSASIGSKTGSGIIAEELPAGQQQVIPNVISYLRNRGLAIPTTDAESQQGGTLAIEFIGATSEVAVAATARTTTSLAQPHPQGAAGLAYPGLPASAASTGSVTLYGLRANVEDRSNVAVFNPATIPVTVKMTAYSGSGDGISSVIRGAETIPALGWFQISGVFNGTGISSGWVSVERTSTAGVYNAYGVVNDNTTSDGSFLVPASGSHQGTRLTIPVLTETALFRSELILANRGNTSVTLGLNYKESLSPALGAGGSVNLNLGPRRQQIISDALEFLRNEGVALGPRDQGSYAGAMRIEVNGAPLADVFAAARTAAQSPAGGQFGLFTPGVYAGEEAATEAYIFGLRADGSNRSNLALINTGRESDGTVGLEIQLYNGNLSGVTAGAVFSVSLSPGEWIQLANPLALRGIQNGWARITRKSGTAPWLAYGVINDGGTPGEGTGDGAYVPMALP
jgi:N-acetylneuraminic acid mutarotase